MIAEETPGGFRKVGFALAVLVTIGLAIPVVGIVLNKMRVPSIGAGVLPIQGNGTVISDGPKEKKIIGMNAFGCQDPYVYGRLAKHLAQNDPVGFETSFASGAGNDRCVRFNIGETVIQQSGPLLPGMIQVLRTENHRVYWIQSMSVN